MSKSKKLLLFAIMIMSCIILNSGKAQAALQANGGTSAKYNVNQWITGIRQMQATGGALGLMDTINGTNLTSTNKDLDIHMQKNTEYGALILLSASSYGNPNKIESGGTTTGNATGVVMQINKEWVAAGMSNTAATSMKNAAGRYKNQYTAPTYTGKIGDGVATVGTWHGSGSTTWISSKENYTATIIRSSLLRAYTGSVFSYYGYGYNYAAAGDDFEKYRVDAHYLKEWSSRAVVVVGSGV